MKNRATLSAMMRDILIEHMDGRSVPFSHHQQVDGMGQSQRNNSITGLIERGLLRPDRSIRLHETTITESGRAMLAKVLGDWAEALIRAGFDVRPKKPETTESPQMGEALEPEPA